MTETLSKLLRASFATATLLTVLLTVILAVVTSQDVRVSISVGLVGTVLAVIITVSADLHSKLDAVARVTTAPIQQLLTLPHLEDTIVGIISSAARAQDRPSPLMSDLMTEAIEQASQRIDEVGAGFFRCERDEELRFVKLALAKTNHRVRAVATRGMQWWDTPLAKVYFDAYGEAAQRIHLIRVFIVQPEERDAVAAILAEERARGVEVHCVVATDVPENCRRAIVLFDDALLHRTAPAVEGFDRPAVEFVDHKDDIERAAATFDTVLQLARRYEQRNQ